MYIVTKIALLALLNLYFVYIVFDSFPPQDESLIYGEGMLQNVDIHTEEDLEKQDPNAYSTHYVYNTRKCQFTEDVTVDKLVFFFVTGNRGDHMQFQPIANSLYEYIKKVEKF